jgi:hypothetical protein
MMNAPRIAWSSLLRNASIRSASRSMSAVSRGVLGQPDDERVGFTLSQLGF